MLPQFASPSDLNLLALEKYLALNVLKNQRKLYGLHQVIIPVDTGRKLNVHKTFRGRPGRLVNV